MTQRASADPTLERNSRIALEEISRLDAMIERLLYFSCPIRLEKERIDVGELCRDVLDAHSSAASQRNVKVEFRTTAPAFAWADRNQLRQVLDNLVSNAIDAVIQQSKDDRQIDCSASSFSRDALHHRFSIHIHGGRYIGVTHYFLLNADCCSD
jgi:C4-dicarboxylate-specific signal transduction histidine kinase